MLTTLLYSQVARGRAAAENSGDGLVRAAKREQKPPTTLCTTEPPVLLSCCEAQKERHLADTFRVIESVVKHVDLRRRKKESDFPESCAAGRSRSAWSIPYSDSQLRNRVI